MLALHATALAPVAASRALHRPRARARARAVADGAPMFGWRPPSGANPLEGALASAPPVEGLGALTGYWFLDVFAAMNVVLILALVVVTSSSSPSSSSAPDDDDADDDDDVAP